MPDPDSDAQAPGELPVAVLIPAEVGRDGFAIVPLLSRTYTLGRSAESDIVLPDSDSSVSRHHARLIWNGDAHELEDAGSSHGTNVNGVRVDPGRSNRLNDGDHLNFAASRFVYRRFGPAGTITGTSSDAIPRALSPLESLDPSEVIRRGLEALRRISGVERSLLVSISDEPALRELLTPLDDPELRVARSLIMEALNERHTVARFVGGKGAIDPTKSMDLLHLRRVWIHPLLTPEGPPVGVAYLDSAADGEPFSTQVEVRLADVCAQIALALRNALLHWELLQLNHSLEAKVEERTRALEASQAQLLAQDRLATLGRLVAGIAHELNNPAAAIDSFSRTMQALLPKVIAMDSELRTLIPEPTQRESVGRRILALLDPARRPALDSRARRELAGRWSRKLSELRVTDAEDLGDKLARTGLEPNGLLPDDPLLGPQRAGIVGVLDRLATFRTGVEMQRECAGAVARIVAGLKTYAHLDAAQAERGDIHKGIEVALAVLASRIPRGVEVITRFGESRPITHRPGELMQVWTNLIDNAIRAMGETGTLTIETAQTRDAVVVRVSDTGHGVPERLRDRIFELDVTTRGPGAGLGLGLPICKRIVESNHGGRISFETSDRGTTFEVRLPVEGPALAGHAAP